MFSAKKFLERKSAVLTTAINLNSYGEQKLCLSFALNGTIGFCFVITYPGSELKNMTSLRIISNEHPLFQIASSLTLFYYSATESYAFD